MAEAGVTETDRLMENEEPPATKPIKRDGTRYQSYKAMYLQIYLLIQSVNNIFGHISLLSCVACFLYNIDSMMKHSMKCSSYKSLLSTFNNLCLFFARQIMTV